MPTTRNAQDNKIIQMMCDVLDTLSYSHKLNGISLELKPQIGWCQLVC